MSRQDRQGVRTAPDLERKYDFGAIGVQRETVLHNSRQIAELTQKLSQYMTDTDKTIEDLAEEIEGIEGVQNIEQTTTSTENGGTNVITITLTDGSTHTFNVKNGTKGSKGDKGDDGIPCTHEWNGTTLKVTSASGTSSANLKGDTGASGSDGKDGTSVTVSNVTESTADGGSNVVTFSDGKTVTIKNGSKGSTGATGPQGPKGDTGAQGNPTTVNGKSGASITLSASDVGALNISGGTLYGQFDISRTAADKASPIEQDFVINYALPSGTALTEKNAPGIGFHVAGSTWGSLIFDNKFKFINADSSGYLPVQASEFIGNLNGNATSATKATQDGNGKVIANTYIPLTGSQNITGALLQNVDGNPYYGLNDGAANWYLQSLKSERKVGLGPTWANATKWDASGNMEVVGTIKEGGIPLNWYSSGTSIPSNADLNTYTTVGKYYAANGTTAASLANCPTTANFKMYVFTRTTSKSINQLLLCDNDIYMRGANSSGTWGDWKGFLGSADENLSVEGSLASGDKSSADDGELGAYLSDTGHMTLQASAAPTISFKTGSNTTTYVGQIGVDSAGAMSIASTGSVIIQNGTGQILFNANSFRSQKNDTFYLGDSNYKWKAVYAVNGTIQTSDRNQKENIVEIGQKYEELFDRLKPVTFELVGSEHDRTHIGFIAQDVKESMDEIGLSDKDLAAYCVDGKKVYDAESDKEVDVLNENGEPINMYSLRYTEFIALNTHMIQQLKAEIKTLKEEIELLKSK